MYNIFCRFLDLPPEFLQPNGENISCECYEIHGVDMLINNWNSYKNEPTGPTLTLFYQQLKIWSHMLCDDWF